MKWLALLLIAGCASPNPPSLYTEGSALEFGGEYGSSLSLGVMFGIMFGVQRRSKVKRSTDAET